MHVKVDAKLHWEEVWLNHIVVSLDTGFLSLKLKDNTQVFCFMAGVSVLDTVRALNEEQFIKQGVEEEEVFSL